MEARSRIWELMAREMSGELNSSEKEELKELLKDHPELAVKLHIMERTGLQTPGGLPFPKKEQMLDNILGAGTIDQVETESGARKIRMRWVWMAASLAVLIISAYAVYFFRADNAEHWNIVQAKRGSKSRVILPDGSIVVLNSGSELSYSTNFMKGKREVKLTGEGYFQVAKQAEYPFIIYTNVVDVRVLGTEFNLRAYPNELKTETSLISGSVEVTIKHKQEQKVLLKPNQKITIDNRLGTEIGAAAQKEPDQPVTDKKPGPVRIDQLHKDPVDNTIIETAWLDNKLVFNNKPFEQLAAEIERAYDVKMVFKKEQLKTLSFSGKVKDESLTELLKILQAAKHFNYSIEKEQVNIY